jgi:hypothetical protein
MSPLDVTQATPVSSADEFDRWLRDHGASEPSRIVAIYKKASGRQTVTFEELLDTGLGRHPDQRHRRPALRHPLRSPPPRLELVGHQS